jgi:hypothetical protein
VRRSREKKEFSLSLHRKKANLRRKKAFLFTRLLHSVRNDKEKVSLWEKRSNLTLCHGGEERDFIDLLGTGVAISHHVIARNEETWQSHIE